jgi:hypothetical protein
MNRPIKKFEEFEKPIDLVVRTKCPEKRLLVDRQTGQLYQGSSMGNWDRLDPIIKNNKKNKIL